ncbi:MAG: response regulator [Deltaproteobacteria bacterium]|nr:response regulator [Deltaproteobacteria bacterium]
MLVHESPSTVRTVTSILKDDGYEVTCVENGKAALQNVTGLKYDILVTGLNIPKIKGLELIKNIRFQNNCIPIVILSNTKSVETAVEAMRIGADDFIAEMTENSGEKLLFVIERAIESKRAERRMQIYESNLPICMHCKRIRYEKEQNKCAWVSIEEYFNQKMSGVNFSHGICPECIKKYYPDVK